MSLISVGILDSTINTRWLYIFQMEFLLIANWYGWLYFNDDKDIDFVLVFYIDIDDYLRRL